MAYVVSQTVCAENSHAAITAVLPRQVAKKILVCFVRTLTMSVLLPIVEVSLREVRAVIKVVTI